MESTIEQIETLLSKSADHVETKVELFKLKMADKVSEAVSSIISKIAIVALIGIALMILSLGAAFWIGSELNNLYSGFFIVGGFYLLAGILIHLFRKSWIKKPISNIIIDSIIK